MEASPVKRRVLGALDPNACSPKVRHGLKQSTQSPIKAIAPASQTVPRTSSPTAEPESRKRSSPTPTPTPTMASRPGDDDQPEPAAKRPCLDSSVRNEDAEHRQKANPESPPSSSSTTRTTGRSASPDTSSVFDTSAQTILTEPDATAPPPAALPPAPTTLAPLPRPRVRLTREQAREKAEILRLRLGLASYKVRTGQTDVPLERLQMRPIPGTTTTNSRSFSGARSRPNAMHRHSASASASTSFPPPLARGPFASSNPTSNAAAMARRRPLPGAPVRRASEERAVPAPTPARNIHVREEGRLAAAAVATAAAASSLVEERGGETGRRRSVQEQAGTRDGGEGHGQRRRMSEVAGPPRGEGAITPGDGDGEDRASGDDGLRGGAASGLLSLARS